MSGAPMLSEHVTALARAAGCSPDWEPYHFEVLSSHGERDAAAYKVSGGVAPVFVRGKRKGERNWSQLDRETVRTYFVTPQQHQAWLADFERTTGKCFNCGGDATEFASWSASEGTRYRPCSRCKGTGVAP